MKTFGQAVLLSVMHGCDLTGHLPENVTDPNTAIDTLLEYMTGKRITSNEMRRKMRKLCQKSLKWQLPQLNIEDDRNNGGHSQGHVAAITALLERCGSLSSSGRNREILLWVDYEEKWHGKEFEVAPLGHEKHREKQTGLVVATKIPDKTELGEDGRGQRIKGYCGI